MLVGSSGIEQSQVFKSFLLQGHQDAGNDLLPLYGLRLQTVGHHVVNVLDEDDVGLNLVQVLYQRTVSAGTEQQRAVGLTERRVVGIGSNSVCRRLLLREGDVVLDAILAGEAVGLLGNFLAEEVQMFVRDGEVDVSLTVGSSIECTLDQMLFHGRARALVVLMEEEHALWQLAVVQSFAAQHVGSNGFVVALGHKLFHAAALILQAHVVESIVEGKLLNLVKILLLEISGRNIAVTVDKSEHVLEHAAGGTRCRHELHHALALGLVLLPGFDILLALSLVWGNDAIADGCGSFESQERESCFKRFQLAGNLRFADSTLCDLF